MIGGWIGGGLGGASSFGRMEELVARMGMEFEG